jgi:RHS repeat-associated protein
VAYSGIVNGTVSQTYNNNFWTISQSINGSSAVTFTYDNDGLLTKAGSLVIQRDAVTGFSKGTTLGNATTAFTYNTFGELITNTAKYSTTTYLTDQYTYDKLSRITQKTETTQAGTDQFDYSYDLAGRLTEVKKNGAVVSTYIYDPNGNRLNRAASGGTETGAYDDQDRLLSYGNFTYSYTANGELKSKTNISTGQTTQYNYDLLGNLIKVVLPDGKQIEYIIDGQNRRIGKKINGTLVQGFLYQNQLKPVVELDGNNNIISRFVYGTKLNVPDYMVKGGKTYQIISDHLGSPLLIIDTSNGEITQKIDYDEFGRILSDTNPGFQPFGFAGGLYDPTTDLTRFGFRDYDASIGRWTAKDPIGFAGGDSNLYGYVVNDPINFIDSRGLFFSFPSLPALIRGALKELLTELAKKVGRSILIGRLINLTSRITDFPIGPFDIDESRTPQGEDVIPEPPPMTPVEPPMCSPGDACTDLPDLEEEPQMCLI